VCACLGVECVAICGVCACLCVECVGMCGVCGYARSVWVCVECVGCGTMCGVCGVHTQNGSALNTQSSNIISLIFFSFLTKNLLSSGFRFLLAFSTNFRASFRVNLHSILCFFSLFIFLDVFLASGDFCPFFFVQS